MPVISQDRALMQTFMHALISLYLFAGASEPMQGSQYTFRLVQICTPEPCKLVLISEEEAQTAVYGTSVQLLC